MQINYKIKSINMNNKCNKYKYHSNNYKKKYYFVSKYKKLTLLLFFDINKQLIKKKMFKNKLKHLKSN